MQTAIVKMHIEAHTDSEDHSQQVFDFFNDIRSSASSGGFESRAVQCFIDLDEMTNFCSDPKFKNKSISKIALALLHELADKPDNLEQALKIWQEMPS